jgi:hypothetical protein
LQADLFSLRVRLEDYAAAAAAAAAAATQSISPNRRIHCAEVVARGSSSACYNINALTAAEPHFFIPEFALCIKSSVGSG